MAAADNQLLFGLLALQNGLIDQVQLVAAFQAWTRDKQRELADHLLARGDLDKVQRSAVEALLALHIQKHGGAAQSLAAIPAGRSTQESLAGIGDPDIDATLSRVVSTALRHDTDDDDTTSYTVGTATSDGQRFRVLRPHARGGLGAVFVAIDGELHREVALKQILDRHADDPSSRARFVLEAEITGGLEHPGIVPVYGLGAYADGRPYYAMRFIKGDSLKEAIEQFHQGGARAEADRKAAADPAMGLGDSTHPTSDPGRRSLALHKLLRRFIDVCNAIDYAHSRGVLHRDIKPGNIIVGKHGETLVVDWGLAKPLLRAEPGSGAGERTLVPSSASGSSETLPGSAMGTPAYMSPEQAAGDLDRLGPRSDVYSLGATLYCLLTGKPPFEGVDVGEVLREVQKGEFVRPSQLDRALDKALEAVCLKAMANGPEERYGTCRSLADDVERWMADEPVSAWREPLTRRARRWAARNRTAVTAAAVALVAGVIGLSAVLLVQTRAKADIARALGRETQANRALASANDELARSKAAVQARYNLAVAAIKTFHTGVSEDFLLKEDKFKELRDRLLNSAAEFYGKLAALLGRGTDFTSHRELAAANFELAWLMVEVGLPEDGLKVHRSVLAARQALATEPEAGVVVRAEQGKSLTVVAGLLGSTGKAAEALAAFREAESVLASPAAQSPQARTVLADCRSRMGWFLYSRGRHAEALAELRLARSDQEALAAAAGASDEVRRDQGDTINWIGCVLGKTGQTREAEAEFRAALAILRKAAEGKPAASDFQNALATCHGNFALLLAGTGRAREAEAEHRAALAIFQDMSKHHPAVSDFRNRRAIAHLNLGYLLSQTGRPQEAEADYRQAVEILQKLTEEHAAVSDYSMPLAITHLNLGNLLSNTNRTREARAEYGAGLAIHQKLAEAEPGNPRWRREIGRCLINLGNLDIEAGRPDAAADRLRESVALHERLAAGDPAVTDYRNGLAYALTALGRALHRAGRGAEAEGPLRRAAELREAIPDLSLEARFDQACGLALLASTAALAGPNSAAAAAAGDRAMAALREALAAGFRDDPARIRDSRDLAPLRDRADFSLLLLDMAMPADPFARGEHHFPK
jgi:eukaryotic-like serine/threonine-protein kinase